MSKSYLTNLKTPFGDKYLRADEVTDDLMAKIKDETTNIFVAYVGVTPFDDVKSAYDDGDVVIAMTEGSTDVYPLKSYDDMTGDFEFSALSGNILTTWLCGAGRYTETNNWNMTPTVVKMTLRNDVALEYDSEEYYHYGNLCYHNGQLYRCVVDTVAQESWTPDHWYETTVGYELGMFSSVAWSGRYSDLTNIPTKVFAFSDNNYPDGNTVFAAILANNDSDVTIKRTRINGSVIMYRLAEYSNKGDAAKFAIFIDVCTKSVLRMVPNSSHDGWIWLEPALYDTSINELSTNAVQNQAVYSAIHDLQSRVTTLENGQ